MSLRRLFNRFFPPLNPLEQKLLQAVGDKLDPETQAIWRRQLEQINYVRRWARGKEVSLYALKRGKQNFDPTDLFPADQAVMLASAFFEAERSEKQFRADFYLVQGRIFSMEFNESPREVRKTSLKVHEVRMHSDPMAPVEEIESHPLENNRLEGWVAKWVEHHRAEKLRTPLPRDKRDGILGRMDGVLPTDYLELVGQTEGLTIDGCVVFGVSEIRSVVDPDRNYYMLADLEGQGALTVAREDPSGVICFLSYEGDWPVEMGFSFREAVDQLMRNRTSP